MNLWAELKRRNVIRVGTAYLVASWLLVEASAVALEAFGAPEWVPRAVLIVLAFGFPIALIFAWAFEVTPEGIKRESEVDRSKSITPHTGRRLNILTMMMLVLVVALVLVERFVLEPPTPTTATAEILQSERVSIAVLPFANMSADADNEYFADGISEEILNLLADVRDLSVASRTSAFAFKGSNSSIPDIAQSLGVRYVLEGSVRKSGQQVRVTAQLIDASNDRHLWSETYDRVLDDIFAIQDEIAGAIGQALRVELLGQGGQRIGAEQIDAEVYAEFLEARYLLRRRNSDDLRAALIKIHEVVESEPEFARGHVILAEALLLNHLVQTGAVEQQEALSLTRLHAERARELNPDLGGIYLALGMLAQLDQRNFAQGLAYYDRAIELEPDEPRPYHWRAITLAEAGLLARGLESIAEAYRLEPENANVNGEYAEILSALGDYERASAFYSRQAQYGNASLSFESRFLVEILRGDLDAAERSMNATEQAEQIALLMAATLESERNPSARRSYEQLLSETTAAGRVGGGRMSREGIFAMTLMLVTGAEELWLENWGSEEVFGGSGYLYWHPQFAHMRRDPRFMGTMERLGLTSVWRSVALPAECRSEGDSFVCGMEDAQ